MKTIAIYSLAVILTVITACGGSEDSTESPSPNPSVGIQQPTADPNAVGIRGTITTVSAPVEGGSLGAIIVEGPVEADTRYSKAGVRITEVTQYFRRQGAETVPAAFEDLVVGQRVEVKFVGNVAGSSTAIGIGREIIIIE